MGLGFNLFASGIVASLFVTVGAFVRKAANQPIDQTQGVVLVVPFVVIFIFCMITLSYQDVKSSDADDTTMED
jgi:NADH:ubiquinone oxidoreductase subunit 4 (subunit M)